MKIILLLLLFFSNLFSLVDITLSHKNIKPGSTFAVILQSDKKLIQAPNVIFKNKTYQMFTILGSIKKYEVFLPVDYHAKQQKENVQVRYIENKKIIKKNISIKIVDGKYKQNEIIKVAKGKVTLSSKNKDRTKKEYAAVYKNVYSYINPKDYIGKSAFILPMKSKVTSDFGNARIYNGKTKSYHSGTDFRAKVGTMIYSANDGKVALVMDRFYLGKVVYVDHGRGAYTYYCHMDSFKVKDGQVVKKGDILGTSGKTGRITGPHLHYALRLYNTTVDPLQYASLHNKIIKIYH
ncbi:MAG: M23 family metallopeptidase [Arcobacteraceae bacterium]|nr:M23 family metallopeptidase [Arcobacteraceae bacterium]